jgi:hypothetical protein
MIPVYMQLEHGPYIRTLRGFVAEDAREKDIIEQFCAIFDRVTINRSERCWIVVILDA